jgi:putative oxidoreductase
MKMQGLSRWLFRPGGGSAPVATILIRLAVGGVFFASGLIKFVCANQGAGRFAKLGIPAPEFMANFVGVVEIAAGFLLAVGLATRLAAIPLVFNMLVAIFTSKLPLLFGAGPEPVAAAPKIGLLAFAYQSRLDFTVLLSCLFLFAVGAGAWSLDAWLTASARKSRQGDEDSGDEDLFEAVADEDLFEAVAAARNGQSSSTGGRGGDRPAPLLTEIASHDAGVNGISYQ